MSKTISTLKHRNTLTSWFIILACILYFIPSLIMSHLWIDTKSVHVTSSSQNTPTIMKVDREIKNPFWGIYTVTVYRDEHTFICQGYPFKPLQYNPVAKLPDPLFLSW